MTTTSTATPTTWEDDQEFVDNGTIQQWFNSGWLSFNARWGIFDLKAPDEHYPGSHFRFVNMSPAIPPKAIISAADISGAAQATQSGTLTAVIEIVDKDGSWDVEPKISTPKWVSGLHGVFPFHTEFHAFDSGPTELAATGATAGTLGRVWNVRRWGNTTPVSPERGEKVGQVLTASVSGTLDTATCRMHRIGSPGGNVWMEVYSISAGLPDTLLATSDTRTANSIGPSGNPDPLESFVFSGGDQISITSGIQYAFVITGDWALPAAIDRYLNLRTMNNTLSGTFPVVFGEARGLGDTNYPAGAALLDLATVSGSGSVSWAMPNFVLNTVYTSPDIASLIQAYVNDPGYVQGDPFLIRIRRLGTSQLKNRGFKTWQSPDTPGTVPFVTLSVDWRRRHVGVI